VAAPDGVRPRGARSVPNAAEQLVESLAYETLVGVSCAGGTVPALAERWQFDPLSGRWVLQLRRDATFWTGESLDAEGVVAAWRTSGDPEVRTLAESARVEGTHTLAVLLDEGELQALSSWRYAVVRGGSAGTPVGTGAYRVEPVNPGRIVLTPRNPQGNPLPHGAPRGTIELRHTSASEARDLVDAQRTDANLVAEPFVLLTRDRALAAYASSAWRVAPRALEWSVTYALLLPEFPGGPSESDSVALHALKTSLARDAVRVEARAATPPDWANVRAPCHAASDRIPGGARVAYDAGDGVARDLAERLVALDGGTGLTAVGLDAAAFDTALRGGTEFAFVVAVAFRSRGACASSGATALIDTRWLLIEPARGGER
jgi:hypothetical protein